MSRGGGGSDEERLDPREAARARRRDRDAGAADRAPMQNGSAKRWHQVDGVIARRAAKAGGGPDRRRPGA